MLASNPPFQARSNDIQHAMGVNLVMYFPNYFPNYPEKPLKIRYKFPICDSIAHELRVLLALGNRVILYW